MHKQTVRILVYSSLAILLLALVWGFRQIPAQGLLADQALRESLQQEMIVLASAIKASTQALKFRLLDVLKAEGLDHSTRAFQDSPFVAASLLEWNEVQWKALWYSVKFKSTLQNSELEKWIKEWPLSKLAPDDAHFAKVADIDGQAYFAILVSVRRPNQVPLVGVGIFPASQFGLTFAADENRDVRVFNREGFALALTHPAYLGTSLTSEPLVREIIESDEVSLRRDWTSERGHARLGYVARVSETNLFAGLEAPVTRPAKFQAWVYLLLCTLGAMILNWVFFMSVLRPLLAQLSRTEAANETLRRQLNERSVGVPGVSFSPIANLDFKAAASPEPGPSDDTHTEATAALEPPSEIEPVNSGAKTLKKVVQMALRAVDGKIEEFEIEVVQFGLEGWTVDTDPLQLQTAIEEILKNAVESMSESTLRKLSISAHKLGDRIQLAIIDTGCGIPEPDLEKVFDPFFSTKDSQGVARGLGLNVVRRVIEDLAGQVKLESRRNMANEGTSVKIEWPAKRQAVVDDFEDLTFTFAGVSAETQKWPEVPIRKPKVRTLD